MSQKNRVNSRPKFIAFSLKTLSAAVVSAVLYSNAYGAGLGKLTVLSSLGQPLRAEIELTSVSKDEADALSVKLASVEAFRQANIEFNPALFALRFAVEQRGNRQIVRVTSTQPINEPFVDMLLELGGGNSRLVREYTFLLDPPDLRRTQPAQMAAPGAPAASGQEQTPRTVTRAESVPQPSATERPVANSGQIAIAPAGAAQQASGEAKDVAPSDNYEVKSGDTLARIADQYKPEGISLDQMLAAFQRANPDAFVNNNINRLRAGQILSIPNAEAAGSISETEARKIVVAQAADFNSYRNKLAARALNTEAQKSDGAKQSATGKITAKVEEQPTPANEAKDKLKLSRSAVVPTGTDQSGSGAADSEDRIAKEKALAEANARVKELEKNVSDLQKLLEIKNKDLAERQKLIDAAKAGAATPTPASGTGETATAPAATDSSTVTVPAQSATPAPSSSVTPATSSASAPSDSVGTPTETAVPATGSAAAPAADANAKADAPKEEKPVQAVAKPSPTPVEEPAETSVVDDLMENPMMLAALAALLAGLGALGIYSARRKKLQKEFSDNSMLTDSSSLTANSLFGSTGGQSVDTNNSVFNSNFAPSASQLDTNEVDPVAEADVYIAYGRDAQAEEILKEALRTQPDRNAVRVKLLEIYANRKDLRAFEMLASELYSITKGEGEDWEQAAGLGIEIDPQNPLYAGGKLPDTVVGKGAALGAPGQSLDELNLDALLNTTQASAPPVENPDSVESGSSYFDSAVESPEIELSDMGMKAPVAATENLSVPEIPEMKPEPKVQHTPAPVADTAAAGLDFDFDLSGLGIKEPEAPKSTPAAESAPPELDNADNGLDFDFNQTSFEIPKVSAPKAIEVDESPEAKIEDFAPLDLDDAHADETPNSTAAAATSPASQDFDLSGISLDLTPAEELVTPGEKEQEAGADSNVAEMATKLDLAIAYQEIGDKEGARELLDEVVKGGTSEQTEKARQILQKIA
jgi:pilus assembly protein FimV